MEVGLDENEEGGLEEDAVVDNEAGLVEVDVRGASFCGRISRGALEDCPLELGEDVVV